MESSKPHMPQSTESSRERILREATRLFATFGYHATGMKDLERATGLGRSSLYYQFPSKESVLFEIITSYLRELIAYGSGLLATEMPAEQRLRLLSRAVMRCIMTNQEAMTVCFREVHSVTCERRDELLSLHRQYEQVWMDVVKAGVNEGICRDAGHLGVKALLGMHHYSYLWLRQDGALPPEQIADTFCDLILKGLETEHG